MNKHTPGRFAVHHRRMPLADTRDYDNLTQIVAGNTIVVEFWCADEQEEANAARIVACVNACEGIDDPMELRRSVETLTSQRDELLEALEGMGFCLGGFEGIDPCPACEENEATINNLIAKCKATP